MTALAWLIIGLWLGYCAGRVVSAFKYLPLIDRVNMRNADLEHRNADLEYRIDNLLDWEAREQELMDNRFWRAANGIGRKNH